jgi:hypothetical protein
MIKDRQYVLKRAFDALIDVARTILVNTDRAAG